MTETSAPVPGMSAEMKSFLPGTCSWREQQVGNSEAPRVWASWKSSTAWGGLAMSLTDALARGGVGPLLRREGGEEEA